MNKNIGEKWQSELELGCECYEGGKLSAMTYANAGVDIEAGDAAVQNIKAAVKSTYTPEVIGDIGGFGGMFSLSCAHDMQHPVLVSGTDGVGTKLKLAKDFENLSGVGCDLVAMCANDILAAGARPLFFLDYVAVGKLDPVEMTEVVQSIAEGCKQAGCALVGGEMAEHPGVMKDDDLDLSGFCVGIVDKKDILSVDKVMMGDVLIALPSSGFHSNGYSLLRKCVDFDIKNANNLDYVQKLLAPTKIYVKPVLATLDKFKGAVHSIAHITGGGITNNLNRAMPDTCNACVDLSSWNADDVFCKIAQDAGISKRDALSTFNMGIGMVLVVEAARAQSICDYLAGIGEKPSVIGGVIEGSGVVVYENMADYLW